MEESDLIIDYQRTRAGWRDKDVFGVRVLDPGGVSVFEKTVASEHLLDAQEISRE
jgi:hypothetical protein